MIPRPVWLPNMVSTDGQWEKVVARLYAIFEKDFKQTRRRLNSMPVWWDRRVLEGDQYEEGFWHLITRITKVHKNTRERLYDPRRAERLPWCGPTISNSSDSPVKVWNFKEAKGRIRIYVWLKDWDYAIILEKKSLRINHVAFLVTAFYVDGDSNRKNLQRKYLKREA